MALLFKKKWKISDGEHSERSERSIESLVKDDSPFRGKTV